MKQYLFLAGLWLVGAGCQPNSETKPERRTLVDAVFGSGHLETDNQYAIVANMEGYLTQASVEEGDTVLAGQLLFRLSNDVQQTQVANAHTNLAYAQTSAQQGSPQIQQLNAQIEQARQKVTVDSTNYARYGRLVKTQAVSTSDFENARLSYQSSQTNLQVLQKNLADLQRNLTLNVANAQAQYQIQQENNRYYTILSKGAGVIMNRMKKVGDFVKKGDVIAQLATGNMIIKLDIAEDDIDRLKLGQRALISLNSQKDKVYEATISRIYPAFSTADQSFIVEATFKTLPPNLLNGTQLQANIIVQEKKNALVIPSVDLIDDSYVLVNNEKRKVSVGIRTLEWTEITSGLTENDRLTTPKPQEP